MDQALLCPCPSITFPFLKLPPSLSEPQTSVLTTCGFPFTKALKKWQVLKRTLAHQRHQRPSAYRRDFYLPIFPDHDIVTVSVTDSQHIRSYTVASTRQSKFFNGSIQVLSVITEKIVLVHTAGIHVMPWPQKGFLLVYTRSSLGCCKIRITWEKNTVKVAMENKQHARQHQSLRPT